MYLTLRGVAIGADVILERAGFQVTAAIQDTVMCWVQVQSAHILDAIREATALIDDADVVRAIASLRVMRVSDDG